MKKIIFIVIVFLSISDFSFGQILPMNRYLFNNHILDLTLKQPSFAYSFRKLRTAYSGFAIKIRRGTDNAEANVAFDFNEVVSATSIITVTAVGTSGLVLNQTMSYAFFVGSQTIYAVTWYNQGKVAIGYHADQNDKTLQPRVVLNTAGSANTYPSMLFDGARRERLIVGQPIQNLTVNGINATYMTVMKATENSKEQLSFGYQDVQGNRWALHANWIDDNLYFDAADGFATVSPSRTFQNDFNLYFYKQYSFVRGTSYKTGRYNQNATILNNTAAPSTSFTGGSFGIGYWYLGCCLANPGFYGNVTEIIMFKTDLVQPELSFLETNQMNYWQI